MLKRIDSFQKVVVMQSAVPCYYWPNSGLTLLSLYSGD